MQFPIQHEKKMSLSMIHSHMKFKGFKNVPDFRKFPMFLPNFIAQASVQLESWAPAKAADYGQGEKSQGIEWPNSRSSVQQGVQPQDSLCNTGGGWKGGKKGNGEV